MKKGLVSLILFVVGIFLFGCMFQDNTADSNSTNNMEKDYWTGGVEDIRQLQFINPNYIGVSIILDQKSSLNFDKKYTQADFPKINIDMLVEPSWSIMVQVQKQLEAEKTKDKSKIQIYEDSGRLVSISNFRRIIFILLQDNSPQGIFDAIKLLENRKDIIWVGPNLPSKRIIGATSGLITVSGSFECLSIETEKQIRQTYLDMLNKNNPNGPLFTIENYEFDLIPDYYGTYKGAVVMGKHGDLDANFYSKVADTLFAGFGGGLIDVWKDGKFYALHEAYEQKLLIQEDIRNIAYFHNRGQEVSPGNSTVLDYMPGSFFPAKNQSLK